MAEPEPDHGGNAPGIGERIVGLEPPQVLHAHERDQYRTHCRQDPGRSQLDQGQAQEERAQRNAHHHEQVHQPHALLLGLWPDAGHPTPGIAREGLRIRVVDVFAEGGVHARERERRGIVTNVPGEREVVLQAVSLGVDHMAVRVEQELAMMEHQGTA